MTVSGDRSACNAGYGVSLDGAPNTTVGGSLAGEPNVISSNGPAGVIIFGDGANGNIVRGNYIGTDITGTLDRHNNGPGVTIPQGSDNIVSGNDADRTAPNVIMFNTGPGIHVGDASTRNKLRINRIDLNGDLGINLGPLGILPNDPGDGDAGANDGQNYPVLTSAQIDNGTVTVQGSLNSNAFTRFTVDLYASPACDASGNGEGRQWIGAFIADTEQRRQRVVQPILWRWCRDQRSGGDRAGYGWGLHHRHQQHARQHVEFSSCVTATSSSQVGSVDRFERRCRSVVGHAKPGRRVSERPEYRQRAGVPGPLRARNVRPGKQLRTAAP